MATFEYNALTSAGRLMKGTIEAGKKHNIHVAICGEMGGDVLYTFLLVGMGLKELSVSSKVIPEVKKVIRSVTYEEAQKLADRILQVEDASETVRILEERIRDILPEIAR